MGARDQFRVAHVFQRALIGTTDAHAGQPVRHLLGPLATATPGGAQAGGHAGVIGIEAEADDVHGDAGEGDGNLGAGEVVQALGMGRSAGAVLATDLVVVGQRPELHPVGFGARRQRLGRQRAVGHHGVAMQVGVEDGSHEFILGRVGGMRRAARDNPGTNRCIRPHAARWGPD